MSKMRWDPETGKKHIFGKDETPPANFLPCHPKDPEIASKTGGKAAAAPEPAPKPDDDPSGGMTKAEITDALKAGGVDFDPQNNKAALTEHLRSALKTVLTDRGVAYDENETAKGLFDKVTTAPQE